MAALPRTLHPALNAPGYMAAAGAIYAAAVAVYNAYNHHGVLSAPVILAAVAAIASLLTRTVVTPVGDPHDGNGNPLVTAPAAPVLTAAEEALIADQAAHAAALLLAEKTLVAGPPPSAIPASS